jgi:hypothetical protein
VLKTAQLELTLKTRPASSAHLNVLLASVQPPLVLPAQKANSCSKENALPDAQFHW